MSKKVLAAIASMCCTLTAVERVEMSNIQLSGGAAGYRWAGVSADVQSAFEVASCEGMGEPPALGIYGGSISWSQTSKSFHLRLIRSTKMHAIPSSIHNFTFLACNSNLDFFHHYWDAMEVLGEFALMVFVVDLIYNQSPAFWRKCCTVVASCHCSAEWSHWFERGWGNFFQVRLYQDCLFVKMPGFGVTNWHSDLNMVPIDTNSFLTVWIPLRTLDKNDSSLHFASGGLMLPAHFSFLQAMLLDGVPPVTNEWREKNYVHLLPSLYDTERYQLSYHHLKASLHFDIVSSIF